jgi:hypothetical protein
MDLFIQGSQRVGESIPGRGPAWGKAWQTASFQGEQVQRPGGREAYNSMFGWSGQSAEIHNGGRVSGWSSSYRDQAPGQGVWIKGLGEGAEQRRDVGKVSNRSVWKQKDGL